MDDERIALTKVFLVNTRKHLEFTQIKLRSNKYLRKVYNYAILNLRVLDEIGRL